MTGAIVNRVREYVKATFLYTRADAELGDDDALIGAGIIDSMGVMELIEFLEAEFGIAIRDEEITEENLGTLATISVFVEAKRATPAA